MQTLFSRPLDAPSAWLFLTCKATVDHFPLCLCATETPSLRYLFIGPIRGQNFVHGLHLKWVSTFLVKFLLLPNSRVCMYVGCTRRCPFDQNGGRPVFTMILHLICSYLGRRDDNNNNGWGGVSSSTGEVGKSNIVGCLSGRGEFISTRMIRG